MLVLMTLLLAIQTGFLREGMAERKDQDVFLQEFVSPNYPSVARFALLEGTLNLIVEVGDDGRVASIQRGAVDLNVKDPKAAELFWADLEKDLKRHWRFAVPAGSSSNRLVQMRFVFILDKVGDLSNCDRTQVEVTLHPAIRIVVHGIKPPPG